MAMTAGSNEFQVDATPVTVVSLTADLVDGNFGGGTNPLTLSGYTKIRLTLNCPSGFLATPDANAGVSLWMRKLNVESTFDELAPTGADAKGVHYVGTFKIDDHATAATQQVQQIVISGQDVDECEFYIRNDAGQTIDYVATAITVIAELVTNGPKA